MYLTTGFGEFYAYLDHYAIPENLDLRSLIREFYSLQERIILNNHALAFEVAKGKAIQATVETKEDRRLHLLGQLGSGEYDASIFLAEFGQYALNAYELSSPRFREYSPERLAKLAALVRPIAFQDKITLDNALQQGDYPIVPILIALREYGKYCALLLVEALRKEILKISSLHQIEDIFSCSLDHVASL